MAEEGTLLLTSEWYLESQRITNKLNVLSEEFGLSYDQFLVLEQVIEAGNNTPGLIASVFQTSAPAASRKLNTLQSKRFITKVRDTGRDQRTVWIEVTAAGLKAYRAVRIAIEQSEVQFNRADIDSMGK